MNHDKNLSRTFAILAAIIFPTFIYLYAMYGEYGIITNKQRQLASQNQVQNNDQVVDNNVAVEKPIDTSNWETYTNPTYGFSFKYPKDLIPEIHEMDTYKYVDGYIEDEKSIAKRLAQPDRINSVILQYKNQNPNYINEYPNFHLLVWEKQKKSLEDYVQNDKDVYISNNDIRVGGGEIEEDITKTIFKGLPAYTIKIRRGERADSLDKDKFTVTYFYVKKNDIIYHFRIEESNIYNEILNSFVL